MSDEDTTDAMISRALAAMSPSDTWSDRQWSYAPTEPGSDWDWQRWARWPLEEIGGAGIATLYGEGYCSSSKSEYQFECNPADPQPMQWFEVFTPSWDRGYSGSAPPPTGTGRVTRSLTWLPSAAGGQSPIYEFLPQMGSGTLHYPPHISAFDSTCKLGAFYGGGFMDDVEKASRGVLITFEETPGTTGFHLTGSGVVGATYTLTWNPADSVIILMDETNPVTSGLVFNHEELDTTGRRFWIVATEDSHSGTPISITVTAQDAYGNSIGEDQLNVLLPVELVPDFNRDGKIDDKDRGKVTETDPWRFWINDDDDDGTTTGDDIPGKADSDAKDTGLGYYNVDGVRDLVDFFPLFLDIKQLVEVLPPGTNAVYRLRNESDAINVVFTDLKPDAIGDYLRKSGGASNGLDSATNLAHATARRVNATGVIIDNEWLQKIKDDGKGVLLVEGREKTDKPLILEVTDSLGQKLYEMKFDLAIDSVEKMFRHKDFLSVNGAAGGRGDYKVGSGEQPDNYPDKLCSQKYFVFLHGYNVNAQQARGWEAETFKRLWQSGSKARFYAVTWYGSETQEQTGGAFTPNYHLNVDNAFATAQPLKNFLAGLQGEKIVAAHSLGNIVVSSALHDWQASFSKYLAIDAAMAIEAVDSRPEFMSNDMVHLEWDNPDGQGKYPERLWASEWHSLFSDERSKLTWRDRLEHLDGATVYNFYSSGEEVLDTHPYEVAPTIPDIATDGIGRYAWALQEKLKGRTSLGIALGSNTGGWGFSSAYDTTRDGSGNPTYPLTLPSPAETAQITDAQLRVEPFFRAKTFVSIDLDPELFGTNGSQYAQQHRNTLLAQAFPARTLPVGSHEVQRFADRNYDLNTQTFQNGWPRTDTDWHHSDMREVAYLYTYKLFEKFVEIGGLKQ